MDNVYTDFLMRRLEKLEPIGARLLIPRMSKSEHAINGAEKFAVSTIKLNDEFFTRVERIATGQFVHFNGHVDSNEAAEDGATLMLPMHAIGD